MGRFLSPDWSAKIEPVPYSKLDDPQSLNLYVYVGNNPLIQVDADGHVPLSMGGFEDCSERGDCDGGGQNWSQTVQNQESRYSADLASGLIQLGSSGKAQQQSVQSLAAQLPYMHLSKSGLKFIAANEGWSATAYPDTSGNPTIGYGHLIRKGEDFSKGISKSQGLALLGQDSQSAVSFVNHQLLLTQTQTQFDSLVDTAFNSPRAARILIQSINMEEPIWSSTFRNTLPHGYNSIPGALNRRDAEANLYLLGQY